MLAHHPTAMERFVKRVGAHGPVVFVYEAGPLWLRIAPAAHGDGPESRRGRAYLDASPSWGSGEDGSAGCEETGAPVPGGGVDSDSGADV